MKNVLIYTLYILFVCNLQAQESPWLRCRYLYDSKNNLNQLDKTTHDEMALDIGKNSSSFYSWWQYNAELYKDSLVNTGMTPLEAGMKTAEDKLTGSTKKIYKNLPKEGMLTFTESVLVDYLYEEALEKPNWQLKNEQKEIVGYKCQQAQTNFRGRTWIVWYTPEIPISNGPWKLGGLPGLILEAVDLENQFHFYCVSLEEVINGKEIKIAPLKYIRCTPQKYKEQEILFYEDNIEYVFRVKGVRIQVFNADWAPAKPMNYKLNYIER